MAVTIKDADLYINANCLDIEDWQASDDARKTRMLNVAGRTLAFAYPKYTIPDAAIYEFANTLSVMYSDNGALQRRGVASFGLTGVYNITFKDGTTSMPYEDLKKFIPQTALDLIGAENGVTISKRAAKWVVL